MARPLRLNRDGSLHVYEQDEQRLVWDYLEADGWIVTRVQLGLFRSIDGRYVVRMGRQAQKGREDLLATKMWDEERRLTRTLFVECKAKSGRLSADQMYWRDWLLKRGYEWVLGRFDVVKEYLSK